MEIGVLLEKVAYLSQVRGLVWVPTDIEVDLTALTLMTEYELSSIFDAYYAATVLLHDPNRVVISTDRVYDRIPGLIRLDPRDFEPEDIVEEVKRIIER